MLTCGIVILNYNDYKTTSCLISKIERIESISKIVVVDNKSTDGSFKQLKRIESKKIIVIQSGENGGYSKGNNIGIKYLLQNFAVDIIGISNPDVSFDENFIERILRDFESHTECAVITGLQITPEGHIAYHPFWENYSTGRWLLKRILGLGITRRLGGENFDRKYIDSVIADKNTFVKVGAVEGSLFFIRSKIISDINYFDEGIKFYNEEDILAKKIYSINEYIAVDKNVKYTHLGASTTGKVFTNRDKIEHNFESPIYFFNNYQSQNKILQIINWGIGLLGKFEMLTAMHARNVLQKFLVTMRKEK